MEKLILMLMTVVGSCWAGELGGHGLTLGEIDTGHDGHDIGLGEIDSGGWDSEYSHDLGGHGGGGHFIPVFKSIGVPVAKHVPFVVHTLQVEKVPQSYPVPVFVSKPVPYPVEKQVFTKVEKKVPTPVEKIIPVKIEKPVPFTVIKHVPVHVVKPIPIKIPVYKTIIHRHKGH